MDIQALWQYLGELINQGVEWVGINWEVLVATLASVGGVGGVLAIASTIVRTVVPILKNTNTPVLNAVADFAQNVLPKVDSLVEKITAQESKINLLESENRTLKDYLALAAETNAKSVFLDEATKKRYADFALALKAVPNAIVQEVATKIEQAVADNELTPTEMIDIAAAIPIVEKALGTPITAIVSKGV